MKFYDYLEENKDKIIDIYVDMDGVIAEYDIGNFDYSTIRPLKSNIEKIKNLLDNENINVYILSVCKTNKIIEEKIDWFDKYMDFFDKENIVLISKEDEKYKNYESMELKNNYLLNNINKNNVNILVDDDNSIIKYISKNNDFIKLFQVSSWID